MEGKRRNTDLRTLEDIFPALNEAISVEKRGEWTYERLFSLARRLDGVPGRGGNAPGMDGILGEVEELNRIYEGHLRQCVGILKKSERILNAIPDRRMRTFVAMVYIDRATKGEVTRELDMTDYEYDRCRKRIEQAENMKKVHWPEEE